MSGKLFEPMEIRGMRLRNRVIMPAMGTRMADAGRHVTERLINYHAARAKGGCGLNIVEVSSVHTPSAPAHFVSISEDEFIDGHRQLTRAIHEAGGKAGIQLWQGSIAVMMDPEAEMLVVNDMPLGPDLLKKAITAEEIQEIVACYGRAATRAVAAGYDCIEFHCAHNYLPHSFLSGGLNHRTDEYGGSLENRARFPLACIEVILENIPEDMPLFMRIDAFDDCLPGGMTIEEVIAFCRMAGEKGVDVLDVSRGNIITPASIYEVPPIDIPRGFNVDNAARIRRETGMLTVAVGRINTVQLAEKILEEEKADLVVMGRAQLADPEFCSKAMEGRIEDIIHCIGCNQGCYDGFCDVEHMPFITCLRNPMLGHEGQWEIRRAETPKTVWIAGGGMAGMEAAMILNQRGHRAVIFERGDHLGGQFITAGQAPGKQEMKEAARAMGELIRRMGVEIHLNTPLIAERILEGKPDEIISAIGASPIALKLPGAEMKAVFLANRVLDGIDVLEGDTVIIGGGLVGLETADFLASRGNKVTVLEMLEKAGKDLGALRAIAAMEKMEQLNVEIHTEMKCTGISQEGVTAEKNGEQVILPCQNVIIAVGSRANDSREIAEACSALSIPIRIVGDARKARRALNAVAEAFEAAMDI